MTENPDGTLKVTIREIEDPSGLQATLRADGARVVVSASLAWPAACSEWRGGDYRMGDQVVRTENRTGLPSADGTEFLIKPSAIPAGALLWVGLSQTGRPNHVVWPARAHELRLPDGGAGLRSPVSRAGRAGLRVTRANGRTARWTAPAGSPGHCPEAALGRRSLVAVGRPR